MRTKDSSIMLMAGIRMIILTVVLSSLASGAYNPKTAVSYAKTWDCDGCRNTDEYLVYDADCANFVSQCLIAGGLDLTACTDPEVVTDEKGCIISCTVLDRYLRWVGVNPDCRLVSEGEPERLRAGDVVILACSPDRYQHAMIVANGEGANALYSGHSRDQEEVDFSELPKLLWDKYANDYCETTHINYYHIVQSQPVYFADANLKAAVEKTLGISDPTPTDMLSLTSLSAIDCGIADLTGLEYATNLTTLYLGQEIPLPWRNQISDISPLAGLTNLTVLNLWHNQISDISALSGLTNLSELYLSDNQISDISALSGLTNLTRLGLKQNGIGDISALSGLTNLTELDLCRNQISDISALAGLTNLTELELDHTSVSDISPLTGLTNLTKLYLGSTPISDISPLSGLTNLTNLWLDDNNLSDISALSGLTNLTFLCLRYNHISDISVLSGLTNLTDLFLHYNQISDISALSGLTNLFLLWLHGNPLNQEACEIYIPQIIQNNPGIWITYDSCPEPPNARPVADAGTDQTVYATEGRIAQVTLDGSGSSDPDGDELTYEWTWSIGGDTYNATGINPTIELPVGEHIIQLIVNDGTIDSEPDYVEITILNANLSGWVYMPEVPEIGYSFDEDCWLYFYSSEPVWSYNFTTGQWLINKDVGLIYVDWPFYYVLDTSTWMFALPPVTGLWVYHFCTGEWTVLPRIIPW